ncbi:MAG: 30S ribosomal protein S4 [Deltaproteobacteria bacterium]|nr:30S ribosomal protein S4 [Deltaproteobacteria bacterium]
MARYVDSVCRLCRREDEKLFLKADRCYTEKCAIERRKYAPGIHGQRRRSKVSDYGVQLREKQKARRLYGIMERQFRQYFKRADKQKGVTGENLLVMLERRLDNVVYRMGFAGSRREARHLVNHGHFTVDGRKVNIASFLVKPGQTVVLREKSRKIARVADAIETVQRRGVPAWIEVDHQNFKGVVQSLPTGPELESTINAQLIVELYSK